MNTVVCVENLSKMYRLGQIGGRALSGDLNRWWARVRGKPDPYLKIGQASNGNRQGEQIWALRDVSFEVHQGDVLGIIGQNGAGKSTLLKILSRVTAPTTGIVKAKGRISSLLEVGTGFHPELTGRENIYMNGAILGMSKQEIARKFDEIVDFSGIEQFIDTPVKRYSSGMYVRLAFAVAAHLEPEILVVDEVLAVGDVAFQNKCLGKMSDISSSGNTVLFVSHNMPSIKTLCNRTLMIESGELTHIGSTDQIVAIYLSNSLKKDCTDLAKITERKGTGQIRFTDWKLEDPIFGIGRQVTCGHPCTFKLYYETKNGGDNLKNISVALVIKDLFNKPILSGSTHFKGITFDKLGKRGIFNCIFNNISLAPDLYKIQLWCSNGVDVSDYIEDAGFIEIIPDDIYGTGKFPERKHGIVFVDQEWDLNRLDGNYRGS